MTFSKRVQEIQPSQTIAITAQVDVLRRQGKDIIDLGAGEPDFDTPQIIKDAAIRAIQDGFTKYTPASGILELKQAVCDKLMSDHNLSYSPGEVIVSCGAKHSIMNVLLALCEDGDEVIMASPYWTSYPEQVRFVGAKPVFIQTDEEANFKIKPYQLQKVVNSHSKLLILNSPSNPTGAVYTQEELLALEEVLRDTHFYILSDEIYEKIIYDGQQHVSMASFPSLRERLILVNGVSKAYSMTGWRIGYLAADTQIVKAVAKIQSHSTSNPCSISQKASIAALKADRALIREMVQAFDRRRRFLIDQLNGLPRVRCTLPKGAFYMFPNVSRYFGLKAGDDTIENPTDLCTFILEQEGVAMVPGEAFGSQQHIRISYATSLNILKEAVVRIERALRKLRAS